MRSRFPSADGRAVAGKQPSIPLLQAESVARQFRTGTHLTTALAPLSLRVDPGEFLLITGPSGAGKSTLLNLLGGLDTPSRGEVLFRGEPLSGMDAERIADLRNGHFGFIFQMPHLLPEKTVLENVMLPFSYGRAQPRRECIRRGLDLLEYAGLADLAGRYPATLSGGEMQRVVFARAMVREPEIIFADEPTGSLDEENSTRLVNLLKEQSEGGRTVVMVSHDPMAEQYGTRILRLEKTPAAVGECA